MPRLDEYLLIAQAAEYLGVCANTLRNWGSSGKIREKRHPVNGYRIYSVADLDRLIKKASLSKRTNKPR